MFAYFIGILSGVIVIKAYPDYFSFRRKGQEISFRTVIYLSVDGKPRVLGVCDDQMPVELNVRIDLFKTEESNIGSFDKAECLDAFFRYCIRSIMNRATLIRPRIVFRNVISLKGILCGYHRVILRNAATKAGARECSFQE
jgi:hypothetical protein